MTLLREQKFPVDKIYVPTARRKTLDPAKAKTIADDWLANGQKTAIMVRSDPERNRYVLIEGYHRLEAARLLGEPQIRCILVQARLR
jgi:sulfiredoxin